MAGRSRERSCLSKKMSIQNVLIKELLRLVRKPTYASEHTLRQHIARDRKTETGDPPPSIQRACQVVKGSWQGVPCYTMRPLHRKGANGHMVYLHGGGYVFELAPGHWHYLSALIKRSDVTATVPLYPLAPEHTYRDTYPWLLALYQHLWLYGSFHRLSPWLLFLLGPTRCATRTAQRWYDGRHNFCWSSLTVLGHVANARSRPVELSHIQRGRVWNHRAVTSCGHLSRKSAWLSP